MRSKIVAFLAILFLTLPLWGLAGTSTTTADDGCSTTVIDQAGKFTDKAAVENAANKLGSDTGAVVYVRTVNDAGPGLDQWANNLLASCPNWQSPNGHQPVSFENTAKENILVFAMSMNPRQVSIYYGGSWKTALTQHADVTRIQSTTMGTKFKAGDFSGGFKAGIEETNRVITTYQHPNTGSGGTVVNTPPDLSGLWTFLGWVLLVIVAAAIVSGIVWGIQTYARRRSEWMDARQAALGTCNNVKFDLEKLNANSRPSERDAQAGFLSGMPEHARKVEAWMRAIEENQEDATASLKAVVTAVGLPEAKGLTPAAYDDMTVRYNEAYRFSQAAVNADAEIARLYEQVQSDIRAASDSANELGNSLESIEGDLADLTASGLKVDDLSTLVEDARASLERVKLYANQPEVLTALAACESDVERAQNAYDTFVATKKKGQDGIADLQKRLDAYPATREAALSSFKRISEGFNEESWKPVQGNGSQSERFATKAAAELASAKDAFNAQQWEEAATRVQEGASDMDSAETLLTSIIEIEQNLIKAQSELPQVVERVKTVVATANAYIGQYDDDINDCLWGDLNKAQRLLDEVEAAQQESKPRYLTNLKKALEAEKLVMSIYDEAVGEYEAAKHLREQAASMLSVAKTEVSRAKEYIEDHESDVDEDARDLLKAAKKGLASANQSNDPQKVYDYAGSALEDAKEAFKKAKHDVTKAKAARQSDYSSSYASSTYNTTYVDTSTRYGYDYGGSHHDSDSSRHDGGGGSSSVFGGFDSGGGSSSSFGGFDGGGGGASSW